MFHAGQHEGNILFCLQINMWNWDKQWMKRIYHMSQSSCSTLLCLGLVLGLSANLRQIKTSTMTSVRRGLLQCCESYQHMMTAFVTGDNGFVDHGCAQGNDFREYNLSKARYETYNQYITPLLCFRLALNTTIDASNSTTDTSHLLRNKTLAWNGISNMAIKYIIL